MLRDWGGERRVRRKIAVRAEEKHGDGLMNAQNTSFGRLTQRGDFIIIVAYSIAELRLENPQVGSSAG
jgi:hypothetical protein